MTSRDDDARSGPDPVTPAGEGEPASRGVESSAEASPRPSRRMSAILSGPARSVRSRVLLVFLVVSALLMGAVIVFVQHQGAVIRGVTERIELQEARESGVQFTRELLEADLGAAIGRVEAALGFLLASRFRVELRDEGQLLRLGTAIRELDVWDDPVLRRYVRYATVVYRTDRTFSMRYFNVRSDLVFPARRLTGSREPGRMIDTSLERDDVVLRGARLAGPLRVVGANWGGFYFELFERPGIASDLAEHSTSGSLLLILLLLIPGLVFLFGFTWRLISKRLLEPVERLGHVAQSAGRGDYSLRLAVPSDQQDEVARVMVVFNRMLSLVEDYRDDMEGKVRDAADEIAKKNQQLMLGQRLAATGTLASGIAHEINNPLGGMLNVAKRLERPDITEEQRRKYIEILEEGIERIGAIVRKVLEVSPRKSTPTSIVLDAAIDRTIDLVQHRASSGGVEIVREIDGPLPAVLGESNEIGQILLNLMINAIDACDGGGGTVTVRAHGTASEVIIEVADDGVGMEPEVADQAFDLFFTTKDAGAGTGLGLATVHSLVQSQAGRSSFRRDRVREPRSPCACLVWRSMALDVLITSWPILLGMAGLLCGSAFFSSAETAVFSLSLRDLRVGKPSTIETLQSLLRNRKRLLVTILLGNLVVNVLYFNLGVLVSARFVREGETVAAIATPVIVLALIVLLGEILPKSLAVAFPGRVARFAARPLLWIEWALRPVALVLGLVADGIGRLVIGHRDEEGEVDNEELGALLGLAAEEGHLGADEHDALQAVLALSEMEVKDLMVPRVDVVSFDLHVETEDEEARRDRFIALVAQSRLNKIPVHGGELDEVSGFLDAKEVVARPGVSLADLVCRSGSCRKARG